MKVSPRGSLTAVSWLIALGIGLIIGRHGLPTSSESDQNKNRTSQNEKQIGFRFQESGESPQQKRNSRREISSTSVTGPEQEDRSRRMIELSDILNTSNRIERTRQMLSFIDQIDDRQMAGIIEGFRDAGWVDYNRSEYTMLISAWMDRDPFTAIAYLDTNETDSWTRKTAISAWAADNPEAAANAIQGLEDEGKVNAWVVGLIEGIARNDPEGALRAVVNLPGGDTKMQAIREILPEVVIRGADFAGDWIEQIDEPKLQRDTAKRLAHSLARRDPESASDWISKISTVETRRDASEVVSEIYAQEDLNGAMQWAESLPQNTMTEAAEGVAKHLTRKDPAEAALWLQKRSGSRWSPFPLSSRSRTKGSPNRPRKCFNPFASQRSGAILSGYLEPVEKRRPRCRRRLGGRQLGNASSQSAQVSPAKGEEEKIKRAIK